MTSPDSFVTNLFDSNHRTHASGPYTVTGASDGLRFIDISTAIIKKLSEFHEECGGQSDVYRATLTKEGVTYMVALKTLRIHFFGKEKVEKQLARESECWRRLDHENIAPFLGVQYENNGAPTMVLPWYENGRADNYLQIHSDVDPFPIIRGIANGVSYLHAKGIIHGDLKGSNVMIDNDGRAKIIDFGSARLISSAGFTTTFTTSLHWCAPELLRGAQAHVTTKASDVYAFASTILELLTHKIPYYSLSEGYVATEIYKGATPASHSSPQQFRYEIPHSDELWALLEMCWNKPGERPDILELGRKLESCWKPE